MCSIHIEVKFTEPEVDKQYAGRNGVDLRTTDGEAVIQVSHNY